MGVGSVDARSMCGGDMPRIRMTIDEVLAEMRRKNMTLAGRYTGGAEDGMRVWRRIVCRLC